MLDDRFYDRRLRRQRRQFWVGVVKWSLALGLIVAAGVVAYRSGSTLAQVEVDKLRREIVDLSDSVAALEDENAKLEGRVKADETRLREWQERYERDVPTGENKAVFALVQEKLGAGVDLERLKFLIDSAENERSCDETPVTKRFILRTPLYTGANDSVGFAQSSITVTGDGEAAVNAAGKQEQWYDPAKPINIRFTHIGGKNSEVSGTLPLHHAVVFGDHEYRFTIVAGSRGFVSISGDRCDYP